MPTSLRNALMKDPQPIHINSSTRPKLNLLRKLHRLSRLWLERGWGKQRVGYQGCGNMMCCMWQGESVSVEATTVDIQLIVTKVNTNTYT